MSQKANPTREVAKPYEATARERAALAGYADNSKRAPPSPRLKLAAKGQAIEIGADHPDVAVGTTLLMGAIGTTDPDFFEGLLFQLANISSEGQVPDERTLNFMLSVIKGVNPQDQVEAMLATQMAAVHAAIMTFARRLAHVENIPQQDSAQNAFNKLTRTFTAQVEALKRYRTGGEQRVTVQHVTVNDGGQAIVGAIAPRPPGEGPQEEKKPTP